MQKWRLLVRDSVELVYAMLGYRSAMEEVGLPKIRLKFPNHIDKLASTIPLHFSRRFYKQISKWILICSHPDSNFGLIPMGSRIRINSTTEHVELSCNPEK